jgi:hypothetical protein
MRPYNRTIQFSGALWYVKSHSTPVGPGPNYFSDSPCNVWVDAQGRLHLKITREEGRWLCAEVIHAYSAGLWHLPLLSGKRGARARPASGTGAVHMER